MQMSPEMHTSALSDTTFPLKQVFRRFGWLAFDFCFLKEMHSFLESIGYFLGGSLCVSAALAYRTLIAWALLLWKCILHLFLTSYINFLCDRMTPGYFFALILAFSSFKGCGVSTFSFFVCTSHSLVLVFVFDDLLINRMCPVYIILILNQNTTKLNKNPSHKT